MSTVFFSAHHVEYIPIGLVQDVTRAVFPTHVDDGWIFASWIPTSIVQGLPPLSSHALLLVIHALCF